MLIFGVDPGTATTGYGFLKAPKKGEPMLLGFGWIKTDKNGEAEKRLDEIYKNMLALLKKHSPDVLAIERLFFYSNAKTAIAVGQAQGVILLAAARQKIPVFQYPPGQVKLVVGGNGRADKNVMKQSIRRMFRVRAPNKKKTHFDDVVDAIAVAVCHARLLKSKTQNG